MNWLQQNAVNVLAVLGALYALALAIVKLTPTPKDDEALEQVSAVVRVVAKLFGLDLRQGRVKAPKINDALLPLMLSMALLNVGCTSPGDQYQASSIAFVAAVDAATELRKAGKLSKKEVEVIGDAIGDGHKVLNLWAIALKKGESYPDGPKTIAVVIGAIRRHLKREED